jgi:hypothetical protein
MVDTEAEPTHAGKVLHLMAIARRLGVLIAIALLVGWVLNRTAVNLHREDSAPAGFGRGLVQGR